MTIIRLETGDWTRNAGLVGIMNILDYSNKDYPKKANFMELDTNLLEDFATDYFNYFEKRYIGHFSYSFIVNKGNEFLERKDWDEKSVESLNKYIESTKKLLTSNSYNAAYQMMPQQTIDVVTLEKKLSKIKIKAKESVNDVQEKIDELKNVMKKILNFLEEPSVKKYIVAKNTAYSIIDNFWGGVSFLHKSSTKNDIFDEYKKYFIEPVLQYLEEDHQKDKYCCLTCSNPIKKLSKPSAYDLAWLNKMGVDMGRKTSHFWNLNSSTSYICPICNLVLSCVPAGFTVIRGQGYFVNNNHSINILLKLNNNGEEQSIREDETIQLAELKSYYQLLDYMEEKKSKNATREIDNIQVIKFSSQTDVDNRRPYTFNVLSKDKIHIIKRNSNMLSTLVNKIVKLNDGTYVNVYQSVLDRLYKNQNQFDLIGMLIRDSIPSKGEESIRGAKVIKEIIHFNNEFLWTINKKKEDDSMSGNSSYVKRDVIIEIENAGKTMFQAYSKKKSTNKISGVTYRLLNALKTKDTGRFMDTFINAHMFAGLPIPTKVIDVLQDENKLQTIGYAFLVGLRSNINETSKEAKGETDNE